MRDFLEDTLERIIFASRWLLAPIYIVLCLSLLFHHNKSYSRNSPLSSFDVDTRCEGNHALCLTYCRFSAGRKPRSYDHFRWI